MKVERVIKVYLTREGIDIPEERLSSIVLELKSWLKPSLEGSGIIKTQEGDFTLMHSHYGEPYHSLYAGAIRECLEKFLNPSGLLEKAQNLKRISILDIGFGLGYNVVYGDRGYRGCEGVIVCDSKDMRAKRQVVEGVISQIKLFNAGSGWRTLTCVLVYVYAYAIGYSYYRRGELEV